MREATGDLNMSVVVIVAVAGLMAFFSITLWPMIRSNMEKDSDCSDAICNVDECGKGITNGRVRCHRPGDTTNCFTCPYKG